LPADDPVQAPDVDSGPIAPLPLEQVSNNPLEEPAAPTPQKPDTPPPAPEHIDPDDAVRAESRKRTRRSFGIGALAAAAGYSAYRWIDRADQVGRLQVPLRHVLNFNRNIARAVFDERGLAPQYPISQSVELRLNGTVGLEKQLNLSSWRLQMAGVENAESHPRYVKDLTLYQYLYHGDLADDQQAQDVKSAPGNGATSKTGGQTAPQSSPEEQLTLAQRFDAMNEKTNHKRVRGDGEAGPSSSGLLDGTPGLLLTMADLMKLPKVELVTQFKCVEGWSQIVHWGGVRLRDLIEAYPPARINGKEPAYVYMETPDGNYYAGYDMAAARHPQSLLVTEMGGQSLAQQHGAPLRLHMPIKYGYKQLKRIGLIAYMNERPDDYWTKLGYDWYAGL
jgi:hypothetical protein